MSIFAPITQRRLEALVIMLSAGAAYGVIGFSWGTFALLFMVPDLSIAVYLVGPRAGNLAYNCAHFYAWPVALGLYGLAAGVPGAQQIALIWAAHVAFDRALGWGLKTGGSFLDTDMGVQQLPVSAGFLEAQPE